MQWDEGLPLPELRGGNRLSVELSVPERGLILDRNSQVLAGNDAGLSLVPGSISGQQGNHLLKTHGDLVIGLPSASAIRSIKMGPDWYIPVGDVSQERWTRNPTWSTA